MTLETSRAETDAAVAALLDKSLGMWGVVGAVEPDSAGGVVVRTSSVELRISRAPDGLPFRWVISIGGRERGAGSVVGLLRHVRAALDPDYKPVRLRIAAPPAIDAP